MNLYFLIKPGDIVFIGEDEITKVHYFEEEQENLMLNTFSSRIR